MVGRKDHPTPGKMGDLMRKNFPQDPQKFIDNRMARHGAPGIEGTTKQLRALRDQLTIDMQNVTGDKRKMLEDQIRWIDATLLGRR